MNYIPPNQEKNPFTISTKISGNEFKEVKDLYIKCCKTWGRESKEIQINSNIRKMSLYLWIGQTNHFNFYEVKIIMCLSLFKC